MHASKHPFFFRQYHTLYHDLDRSIDRGPCGQRRNASAICNLQVGNFHDQNAYWNIYTVIIAGLSVSDRHRIKIVSSASYCNLI
uniref:Uncharacterized protein n=1 Tax=Oryza brachyantha TaxID=4533 RepID=J3KYG3_ORYBR